MLCLVLYNVVRDSSLILRFRRNLQGQRRTEISTRYHRDIIRRKFLSSPAPYRRTTRERALSFVGDSYGRLDLTVDSAAPWNALFLVAQRGTEVSKRLVISTARKIWYGSRRRPNLTVDRTGWVTIGPYGAMGPCRVNRRL